MKSKIIITSEWKIPHPGTWEWLTCESFEQAMSKWFEGCNIPRLVTNGIMEDFSISHLRVKRYYKKSFTGGS